MTTEIKAFCDALDTIPGLTVIRTLYLAEKKDWPLPAVVIDYARPIDEDAKEVGSSERLGDTFFFELGVKISDDEIGADPFKPLEDLEAMLELIKAKIEATFPQASFSFNQDDVLPVMIGKQIALGYTAELEIV